jgi:Ca2+/Na+ antiporter
MLLALLLIGPIPSTVTIEKAFAIRDYMMLPILLIIVAVGLYFLILKILSFKKFYRIISLVLLIFVYVFLFAEYFYQYHYRWPVYGAEGWSASSRDLVNYIVQNKDKFSNVYVSRPYRDLLIQYATLERIDPKIVQNDWNKIPIKISNVFMLRDCLGNTGKDIRILLPPKTLYISSYEECPYTSIPSNKIVDRGEPLHTIWNIYSN